MCRRVGYRARVAHATRSAGQRRWIHTLPGEPSRRAASPLVPRARAYPWSSSVSPVRVRGSELGNSCQWSAVVVTKSRP
jgi:hypothetical protein